MSRIFNCLVHETLFSPVFSTKIFQQFFEYLLTVMTRNSLWKVIFFHSHSAITLVFFKSYVFPVAFFSSNAIPLLIQHGKWHIRNMKKSENDWPTATAWVQTSLSFWMNDTKTTIIVFFTLFIVWNSLSCKQQPR